MSGGQEVIMVITEIMLSMCQESENLLGLDQKFVMTYPPLPQWENCNVSFRYIKMSEFCVKY